MNYRHSLLLLAALVLVPLAAAKAGEEQKPKQKKGWLGVSIQNVTEKIQRREKLPSDEGAYVSEVVDDSPADSAGLKRGDVIVSFGGKAIYGPEDLSRFVSRTAPGTKAEVVYFRDGVRKDLAVVIGSERRLSSTGYAFAIPSIPRFEVFLGGVTLGVTARTLNKQLGEYFGAPNNEGVLVEEVEKGKPGDKAGLKAGDVILRVGKRAITEVDDISKELRKAEDGDKVEVEVLRKGTRKTFIVEVTEPDEMPLHFRDMKRRIRVAPRGDILEWRSDIDDEDAATEDFREDLDEIREMMPSPFIPPVRLPRVTTSVTI